MVMARNTLKGMRIAILVTDGFEQVELVKPRSALDESGAFTQIVSPKDGHVRSWNFTDWGVPFPVNVWLLKTAPDDFDALLLPGGVINPDTLRMPASRWPRSAMARGPSSRRAPHADAG
jgi:protease I